MQRFLCPCGNTLFFDSTSCLACRRPVACDPVRKAFVVLESAGAAPARLCANGVRYGVCNWLALPGQQGGLCLSCRMDRMIPNLGDPRNVMLWGKVEAAKRRLIFELIGLGIPMTPGGRNVIDGLTFRIVSTRLDSGVTMGHLNGLITVNLEEADDTYRQINRQTLGEESRTLLGHFRHESGHFVWQQWFDALPGITRTGWRSGSVLGMSARTTAGRSITTMRWGTPAPRTTSSAPMPPVTHGRTGRRPGRTICR